MADVALTARMHVQRAERHTKVGLALLAVEDEWAAVCLFYSAYHHVKAALLEDPLFEDHEKCQALHADLLPDDRFTSRHKGRRTAGGREWGLNELVLRLYRPAAGTYERLHQASIDVRYQTGLRASIADVRKLHERFETLLQDGTLSSGISPQT